MVGYSYYHLEQGYFLRQWFSFNQGCKSQAWKIGPAVLARIFKWTGSGRSGQDFQVDWAVFKNK